MADDCAPFTYDIRIGWGDCDPANIAYTANIPGFALTAIDAWWEHLLGDGWYQMEIDRNVGTPFVRMSLDFRAPITPRHRLNCQVWPTRLGDASISFRVEGFQNGTLCFEADFVCVFVVADKFVKQSAPDEFRALITPLIRPVPAT